MNKNNSLSKSLVRFFAVGSVMTLVQICPHASFANSTDEGHLSSYDSIVRDLTTSNSYDVRNEHQKDALDTIRFHFGVGMLSSQLNLDTPANTPRSTTLHGYEFSFGIDLFSPEWLAQTDLRAYEPDDIGNNQINFKEFDLLIMHNSQLSSQISWSIGGGLSARYLDFRTPVATGVDPSNSTPASVLNTSLGYALTPAFAVEITGSYRSRLVQNTSDGGSMDASLRLVGHF